MKRYIRCSKYTSQEDVLFDDSIMINIDVDIPASVMSSSGEISRFPGVEQFKQDMLAMLESYHFDVIEDVYDGKLQKGHISDREGSVSVYFDTYYDISNAASVLKEIGTRINAPEVKGKIYCFIHFRFADHPLEDVGYEERNDWLNRNAKKYTKDRDDIALVDKEAAFEVSEEKMHLYYNEAKQDFKIDVESSILSWVRKINRK